jgi:hypothetical protein
MKKLSRYCEMGMEIDAAKLASEILACPSLTGVEVQSSLLAVLSVSDSLRRYRDVVETAHARLPARTRKKVGPTMLGFYCSMRASLLLQRSLCRLGHRSLVNCLFDVDISPDGPASQSAALVKLCERQLQIERDGQALNVLHDWLSNYYGHTGERGMVLDHWSKMRLDEPFGDNALIGMVEIRVADAIRTARAGIKALENYRKHRRGELDIQLPGNEVKSLSDARKKLSSHLKHLERGIS